MLSSSETKALVVSAEGEEEEDEDHDVDLEEENNGYDRPFSVVPQDDALDDDDGGALSDHVYKMTKSSSPGGSNNKKNKEGGFGRGFLYTLSLFALAALVLFVAKQRRNNRTTPQQQQQTQSAKDDNVEKEKEGKTAASLLPYEAYYHHGPLCVSGRYYYTYLTFNRQSRNIGFVDLSERNSTNQNVCQPDCDLRYLAFDGTGKAYGHCLSKPKRTLVSVDLSTCNTTVLGEFPTPWYRGLAYNPVTKHLYTTAFNNETTENATYSLVKIHIGHHEHQDDERGVASSTSSSTTSPSASSSFATFTNIGTSLHNLMFGFAIDRNGRAFATDGNDKIEITRLFSVDMGTGTSRAIAKFPFMHFTNSIAFFDDNDDDNEDNDEDSSTLYALGFHRYVRYPLMRINQTSGAQYEIKGTEAAQTYGGAICPTH